MAMAVCLALGMLTNLWACGSGPAAEDAGASPPPDVSRDCGRLCTRATACFVDPALMGACVAECISEVTPFGSPGALVLAGCAACLEGHSCTEVLDGVCNEACPHDGLRHWDSRTPTDGGTLPGDRCETTWQQDGIERVVRCNRSEPTLDYDCQCYTDGLSEGVFTSRDHCGLGLADRARQAATGCSWPLTDPCEHEFRYILSVGELAAPTMGYGVRCTPELERTDVTYACECTEDGTVVASFTDAGFCMANGGQRLSRAEANCGWAFGQAGCEHTWSIGGRNLTFRCGMNEVNMSTERYGYTQLVVRCECLEGGVVTSPGAGEYTIAGHYCVTSAATQRATAERLCGWPSLPE